MLSQKSIKNFTVINLLLMSLSYLQYYVFENIFNVFMTFFFFLLRNIFVLATLYICSLNKKYITNQDRDKQIYDHKLVVLLLITSTMIEVVVHMVTMNYYIFNTSDIVIDTIMFIPISFAYELIFDFFHYWLHRLEHNSLIYKHTHKLHHAYQYTLVQFTHCHHPFDLIISNVIPHLIAFNLIPRVSKFTYSALLIYKLFVEISGHTGKQLNTSSFPQCIWLPKFFGIELMTKDHDNHHIHSICNYAKRFSLWDKVFGTYK
jgi:Delta7-sterol 5-desaturase